MLSALVAAAFFQAGLGPVVPSGANRSFQEAVLVVEDALEKGDFPGAERAFQALPKRKIRVTWDDSKATAGFREGFAMARDAAFAEWGTIVPDIEFELVNDKPNMRFMFAADLTDTLEGVPAAASHSYSMTAGDPRLETVIGTLRGRPSQPVSQIEVRNEVLFAVAAYVGMERSPFPGGASFRTDQPLSGQNRIGQSDYMMANKLLNLVDRLRESVHKKQRITAARPRLQVEPVRVQLPPANQGDPVKFSIQVSNPGNAPLSFRFSPDCGCLSPNYAPLLDAGGSAVVTVNVDTVNFVGALRHKFYVYANDAEIPYREIPVSIDVEPLYRFSRKGPSVVQMTESGADVEVILLLNEAAKITAREPRLEGNSGTVTMSPWSGEIEPTPGVKVKGSGYRFQVHLAKSPVPGRSSASLLVSTDNVIFPLIRTNIFAQRGILAMPEAVYFGEIPKGPSVASTLLSRPDLPFKVLKVESDSPYFTASVKPLPGGAEYRLVVEYTGKSDFGPINATITVTTDDPKQPKLMVPVVGQVK